MTKIVYLSWGSLKWNPENLPIKTTNSWIVSDLSLPIEFSRISDGGKGRLTLVIDHINGHQNKIWYAESTEKNVNKAIQALRKREHTSLENIAYINLKNKQMRVNHTPKSEIGIIVEWMRKKNIDVVIWTDLESNWNKIMKTNFTPERAYQYFEKQPLQIQLQILEYIYKSTKINNIDTDFSKYFLKKLMRRN